MTQIQIANKDSEIIAAVVAKLAAATVVVDEEPVSVFGQVAQADSMEQMKAKEFTESPVAGVVYEKHEEWNIADRAIGVVVHLAIILASRATTPTDRDSGITRLINAAKNILATPPAGVRAFVSGESELHRPLEWGEPTRSDKDPWAMTMLPLRLAYTIAGSTSH